MVYNSDKLSSPAVSTVTSSDLNKSDSQTSLAWDDALEKARQRVLAPDVIQSVLLLINVVVD